MSTGTLIINNPAPRYTKICGLWLPPGNKTIEEPKATDVRNNAVFQRSVKKGILTVISGNIKPEPQPGEGSEVKPAKPAKTKKVVDDTPGPNMSIAKFVPVITDTLDKEQLQGWLDEENATDKPRAKVVKALEAGIEKLTQPPKEDEKPPETGDNKTTGKDNQE